MPTQVLNNSEQMYECNAILFQEASHVAAIGGKMFTSCIQNKYMYENSVDKIVHAPGDQYSSKIQNKHRGLFKLNAALSDCCASVV
jgi:hypothetical protein